ncbi:HAMP domain-containing histidine kinase [Dactylosporangium vinaceum]|uniref:histidine kinase n=1 Tax=Dactylosporangium vinaceum TaxID=53362 RepID=A0ABV5MH16_9ACTN|nr:histidine kinase dimerization/phospho-acceptor domain-containing protein [Dactylosporangium vinaceum]UAB94933.1 HAMP domain-containing histidine kinase [Dactylosporangium vinaceum]
MRRGLDVFATGEDPAARMRHELHTPLTSIKAYTRLLRDDLPANGLADGAACLDAIDRNAVRLERYVDSVVLPLAATGAPPPREGATDLVAVVRDAVDLARRVAVAGAVSVHADVPDTARVAVDEMICRHLVGQLVLWLTIAAPPHAHVEIALRRDPALCLEARFVPAGELTTAAQRRPSDNTPRPTPDLQVAEAVANLCGGDLRLDATSFRLSLPASALAPSPR